MIEHSLDLPDPKGPGAFREDGSPIDEGYERRIVTFLEELERRMQARRTDRPVSGRRFQRKAHRVKGT